MALRLLGNVANDAVAVFVVRRILVRNSNEGVAGEGETLNENPFVVSAIVTMTTSRIQVLDTVERIPLVCDLQSKECELSGPTVGTLVTEVSWSCVVV